MRPPSVDSLARSLADTGLPHPLLVDAARQAIAAGDPGSARAVAESVALALLRPVVNATGVLLHTNLGRAPLGPLPDPALPGPAFPGLASHGAVRATNLELDLRTGKRGSRRDHAATLLAGATGAEAALVVNNGAAAVLLVLAALAAGRAVVVSRGELVEIGGGFRIPEVLATSGARLVEVGTTNRTRLADYSQALGSNSRVGGSGVGGSGVGGSGVGGWEPGDPALLLKVHQSNYRMTGFTQAVGVAELAELGCPVVADIGSGLLDSRAPWLPGGPPRWLAGEPAARQTLAAGAALVTFSGDKLLGGPQAGVVAGRRDLVERCARHPLARALRPGGLVLSALQATCLAYLGGDALAIPFWRMATVEVAELRRRALALGVGDPVECSSVAGGGSLPGLDIPSAGVSLAGDHTASLRAHDPPVIARTLDGRTLLDLRSVDPADDAVVAHALAACRAGAGQPGQPAQCT